VKRAIAVAISVGLLAGAMAVPAEAGKKKKKKTPPPYTMEVRYENPAIGTMGAGLSLGGPVINSSADHVYVTIEILDDASPTGYGDFSWDTDGNGVADTGITVCGQTEEAVEVPANTALTGFMWAVPSPACPGASTSGTVKATFSTTP
jgi:hypothetical protein